MTEASTLPIEYTTKQLFDMCEQALRDAAKADFEATHSNNPVRAVYTASDPNDGDVAHVFTAERKARADEAALEHARGLVGRSLTITGAIKLDVRVPLPVRHTVGGRVLRSGRRYSDEVREVPVLLEQFEIVRAEQVLRIGLSGHDHIRLYVEHGGQEHYIELPRSRTETLLIDF